MRLTQKCDCETGYVYNHKWDEWTRLESEMVGPPPHWNSPEYEAWAEKSDQFEQKHPQPDEPEELVCPECDGLGYTLTDEGQEVAKVVAASPAFEALERRVAKLEGRASR